MAKPKHRKFNADKFIDVFAEHIHLLRDFARYFDSTRFPNEENFDLNTFKKSKTGHYVKLMFSKPIMPLNTTTHNSNALIMPQQKIRKIHKISNLNRFRKTLEQWAFFYRMIRVG